MFPKLVAAGAAERPGLAARWSDRFKFDSHTFELAKYYCAYSETDTVLHQIQRECAPLWDQRTAIEWLSLRAQKESL